MRFLEAPPKILLLDDDTDYKERMSDQGRLLKREIEIGLSPSTAVRFTLRHVNHIVVAYVDYNFGYREWDGLGLITRMREVAPSRVICYLLTSASITDELKDKAMEAGAYDVLSKGNVAARDLVRYADKSPAVEALRRSTRDQRTGLINREVFQEILLAQLREARRSVQRRRRSDLEDQKNFAILFLDLNSLKEINDKHGHSVGHAVIRRVARVLIRSVRASDYPCRYGGDEFAVMMNNVSLEVVRDHVGKIERGISRIKVLGKNEQLVEIVAAIGVSLLYPSEITGSVESAMEALLGRAGEGMYIHKAAKKGGRVA